MKTEIIEFLKESNAIERVYNEDSLQQAIYAWEYIEEQTKLNIYDILHTHYKLMRKQDLHPDEIGFFRRSAVYIGGKQGINHKEIGKEMSQWILNVNDTVKNGQKESEIWKENIVKFHHIEYEKIHPFIDGNGRTGRIFMNWERIQLGLPILIIHEGIEQMEYYKWFI